jgi:hypothetical protein
MKKIFGVFGLFVLMSTAVFAQTHFSLTGGFCHEFYGNQPVF